MRTFLAAALLAVAGTACAGDWLVVSGVAKHLDGGIHCNSTTSGLGYERGQGSGWRGMVGFYRNSNCEYSGYAAEAKCTEGSIALCGLVGAVTGYSAPIMPVAGLALAVEGRHLGANLIFIPPWRDSGNVLWLQGKVRW
jgi:hypothetical protein